MAHTFCSWLLFWRSLANDLINFLIIFQLIRSLPNGKPCGRIEEEHLLISCPYNTPACSWDQLAGNRFALVTIFIHSLIVLYFLIIFFILWLKKHQEKILNACSKLEESGHLSDLYLGLFLGSLSLICK